MDRMEQTPTPKRLLLVCSQNILRSATA